MPSLSSKNLTVISYPVPPYNNNIPINAQYYQPSQFFISAVTLGITTIVTTTVNNNYVIGQLCRLLIPPTFGCRQLNEAQGYVLSIPAANQVILNINSSRNVDPFVSSSATTQPQILAIGDINTGFTSTNGRSVPTINGNSQVTIPGAFINISPV